MNRKLNFIDLFAGAGGLSEGFVQAGFEPIAHVEMNEQASQTLETRAAYYFLKENGKLSRYHDYQSGGIERNEFIGYLPEEIKETVICAEMSKRTIKGLFQKIDSTMEKMQMREVDVIIGGPPCQAYSLVGRAQSSHMIVPMEEDPRNELYKMYTQFLTRYQPKMFVFENVAGIKTARNGDAFRNLISHLKRVGYEVDFKELNAKDFGVLQSRKRIIIIGWLKGTNYRYPEFESIETNAIVNDLLDDLPRLQRGKGERVYRNGAEISQYLRDTKIRQENEVLTNHVSRMNQERDVAIYERAIRLWNEHNERLKYGDLPEELRTHKNLNSFVDRFKVVEGNLPYCHTILAHLSKDGHYFIHPDIEQCRSITVREAARIQSFPDNYFFEGSRTAQFVQVGNAVPPIMARRIAEKIAQQLNDKK